MKTNSFYYVCADGVRIDDQENHFNSILEARRFYKELTHFKNTVYSINKRTTETVVVFR